MWFLNKFFEKHKDLKRIQKEQEKFLQIFKTSMAYPDYPNVIFYYQFFMEKVFKNYILSYLLDPKLKKEPPCHILELGAFITRTAKLLPEEYKNNYIISDINLDVLKLNPVDYARVNLNFPNLPFKDKTFPIILGTNIFSHILGLGKVEEIKRTLKDDGKIIFIEDLPMYAPGISLFFEILGKKSFFIYDPTLHQMKVFIFNRENFKKAQKEIAEYLKAVDVMGFIKRLRENQASEILIQNFEEFNEFLQAQGYLNNIEFSASLFSLTVAFYSFLPQLLNPEEVVIPFENLLTILKNLLENNCEKAINNLPELLEDEDFRGFLKEKGLKINYDFVTAESNKSELLKWQRQVLEEIDPSILSMTNPNWQALLEARNNLLNTLGLKIGALGEKYNHETGIIHYTALIITLEKLTES